jgi:selenocysteine-specific elongation factor
MRHLILGTAGHVDHGKTELVRTLTGLDTDRLKEEKERGISIELGFAPLPLDKDTFLGIVDVPGHERFVKHMVAGAGGIDLAMLLVAADEGVMPQTKEHMEVLASLSIGTGLVVLSKYDLAADDMVEILREEIAGLTKGTFLENAPVIKTSAKTGEGLEKLKTALVGLAAGVSTRDALGPFRQPVDRVFHKKGIGVVVTGSCYSGTVRRGDTLELLPSRRTVRVRELQSFGEKRSEGHAGERLAVALQGVKLDEVARGDMLVTPGRFKPTRAIDARVRLASYYDFEVKNRERLRIHHGAREALGRIIFLESDLLRAGQASLVQLRLETELVPGEGDHFVLRKYSPSRVIGGGVVIDPDPERHRRRDEHVIEQLHIKERGDPSEVLLRLIERAGPDGVKRGKTDPGLLETLATDGRVVDIDAILFHSDALALLAETVDDLTGAFLARHSLQWGIDKEELRQKCKFPHPTAVFNRVLKVLGEYRPIFVKGNKVRSGTAGLELSEETRAELDGLNNMVKSTGVCFSNKVDLEKQWKSRHPFGDAVQYLKDVREVVEVGENGLIHREAVEQCVEALWALFDKQNEISVADVKNALGLTRKHTIPILEMFDEARVTSRMGDARVRGVEFPEPTR